MEPHEQRAFEEDGFTILRGFLPPAVVQGARDALAILVDRLAQGSLTGEPFETRLLRLYENRLDEAPTLFRKELHLTGLFDVFFWPALLDRVETLLGPEIRLYPNYSARPKFPAWKASEVLWHQDGGYTAYGQRSEEGVDALRMVNAWTALVPATRENGCMEFVPGTHRLGIVPHVVKPHYLEVVEEYLAPHVDRAVAIETEPGDIVLFHNLLFHRGLPNHSPSIRWSLDWRYQDANQPTQRPEDGHLARSRREPGVTVHTSEQWASLSFR